MADPRKYLAHAAATPPSPPGAPSEGYPQTAVPGVNQATEPGPYWYYQLAEEIRNIILAGNLTPDHASVDQAKTVVDKLFGRLNNGNPNGALAAVRLYERCWDTSQSPAQLYISTSAGGTVGTTEWTRARDMLGLGDHLRGYISGMVPSNGTDADHDLDFTAGAAFKEDGSDHVAVAALTKQFDAAFSKGDSAGGLGDGVSLPASGTLHIFAIRQDSTGDGDLYGDTDIAASNVPSGWSVICRVFSITTDASNNLVKIVTSALAGGGIRVRLKAEVRDANGVLSGTAEDTIALSVPGDIRVVAFGSAMINASSSVQTRLYPVDADTLVVDQENFDLWVNSNSQVSVCRWEVLTNTSRQIKARSNDTITADHVITKGWVDRRAA